MGQLINSLRSVRKRKKIRIFVYGKTKSKDENSERTEVLNCHRKFGIFSFLQYLVTVKIKHNVALCMAFNWQKASQECKLKININVCVCVKDSLPFFAVGSGEAKMEVRNEFKKMKNC